jgi:2-oxoglutarate dehydrogenase E2 component (dihydrolipoamide succinyltransferase)
LADVVLPSLGESITEGIIVRWFKAVGETIERDEPILEISTDKVDSELPAPASGVVTALLFEEGDTVGVGATVATIGAAGEVVSSPPPTTPAETPAAPEVVQATVSAESPAAAVTGGLTASPMVRRLLADAGITSARVGASGAGGRITRQDAERALLSPPAGGESVVGQVRPLGVAQWSGSHAPQGFVAVEADYDAVLTARRSPAAAAVEAEGIKLHEGIFTARAAVEALSEFPILNALVTEAGVELHTERNIGIAVDLGNHLLVPVVAGAQDFNLRGLAHRVADLVVRSKAGDLGVEDLLGGTFTISAPASREVLLSIPQLFEPQVAILGMGGISRKPVVLTDADGSESIAIRPIGVIGLAFDARVVDATTATKFLKRVAELLAHQNWTAEL